MPTNFAKKYPSLVAEKFALESLSDKVVNQDYSFEGAKSVVIQSVQSVALTNYTRSGVNRYGTPVDLANTVQEVTLANDKAFSIVIDALDEDETAGAVQAGTALARQLREVIIPTVDLCRFTKMIASPGITLTAVALSTSNIYDQIIEATSQMDENEVPVNGRQLIITATNYKLLKKAMPTSVDSLVTTEQRQRGVIGMIDGMEIVKVPSSRIGNAKFGFMIAHPSATVGPVKLEDFITHKNPPGINGTLCEGRVVYDAFVLTAKSKGIALQMIP